MKTLTDATMTAANAALAGSGFTVNKDGRFVKDATDAGPAKPMAVRLCEGPRQRLQARTLGDDSLLWSGTNPRAFTRAFWFTK